MLSAPAPAAVILLLSLTCSAALTIDINIKNEENNEKLLVERNTTSTVYKSELNDVMVPGPDCSNKNVTVGEDLVFGSDNIIRLSGELSWSEANIVNIDCVSEFVMMMRDADNDTSPATVLCPGYKIISDQHHHYCQYTLSPQHCDKRLFLMLGL